MPIMHVRTEWFLEAPSVRSSACESAASTSAIGTRFSAGLMVVAGFSFFLRFEPVADMRFFGAPVETPRAYGRPGRVHGTMPPSTRLQKRKETPSPTPGASYLSRPYTLYPVPRSPYPGFTVPRAVVFSAEAFRRGSPPGKRTQPQWS